jgi:hypothetical protein
MPNFIAGRYTATYNSLALGQTAEGFRLSHQFFKRLITGDAYAEAPQDAVYRGAELTIAYRLIQYDADGVLAAMWPYAATLFDMGVIGRTDVGSQIVKSLVLTVVAGTPAVGLPNSITLPKAILQEGFPVELLFAPDLREVPMRQRIYPDQTTGVFGTQT